MESVPVIQQRNLVESIFFDTSAGQTVFVSAAKKVCYECNGKVPLPLCLVHNENKKGMMLQ